MEGGNDAPTRFLLKNHPHGILPSHITVQKNKILPLVKISSSQERKSAVKKQLDELQGKDTLSTDDWD